MDASVAPRVKDHDDIRLDRTNGWPPTSRRPSRKQWAHPMPMRCHGRAPVRARHACKIPHVAVALQAATRAARDDHRRLASAREPLRIFGMGQALGSERNKAVCGFSFWFRGSPCRSTTHFQFSLVFVLLCGCDSEGKAMRAAGITTDPSSTSK